jgi:hypothetical protein
LLSALCATPAFEQLSHRIVDAVKGQPEFDEVAVAEGHRERDLGFAGVDR